MSWLLDAQIFLWMSCDTEKLTANFLRRLKFRTPPLYFSAASAGELAIKVATGKLTLPEPVNAFIEARVNGNDIEEVPVSAAHALAATALPLVHRDPFDRILAAQALEDDWTIVTADPIFRKYGCRVLNPRRQ